MIGVINHPSIILITGGRGNGKSGTAHFILENFHEQGVPVYMLVFPQIHDKIKSLVPEWVNLIEEMDAPENCVIFCDESYLKYHSSVWNQSETKVMENLIGLSRHRKQSVIFIAHITRKFSVTLLDLDVLVCKKPGPFHNLIERTEFRKLSEQVKKSFETIPEDEKKKYSYVFSDKYSGFITNTLCSYWTTELSEAWSGIDLDTNTQNHENTKPRIHTQPLRILNGLRIWFSPEHKHDVLNAFLYYDGGRISEEAVFCTKNHCHLDFDLQLTKDGFYTPSCKDIDFEQGLQTLKEKKIPHIVDIEHGDAGFEGFYPLKTEQLVFTEQKKKKKDALDGYAEDLKI